MKIWRANSQGSTVVAVLVTVVVMSALATVGFTIWHTRQTPKSTTSSNTQVSTSNNTTTANALSTIAACNKLVLSKGSSEGTAGTIYMHVVITNNGAHNCILAGYPAAFMADAGGTDMAAISNALYTPALVTLAAHGGKAHVVIGLPDAGNFDPTTTACTAAASSKLQLYLPGLTSALGMSFGESACPGFSVAVLQAGA